MSGLADRIRAVVRTQAPVGSGFSRTSGPPEGGPHANLGTKSDIEQVLGGVWWETGGARCFVVERRLAPAARHGCDTIGTLADWMQQGTPDAMLFAGGAAADASAPSVVEGPFIFFDLETTGLNGGAGTHAFLVGCARFDEDRSFVMKQFLLTRPAHERPLLDTVASELDGAGALVSFNGKSFDAPMLETRYLFHRVDWSVAGIPHLDALHPARRFWPGDCSLMALERQMLGTRRRGDVPQAEIPARYFQFIRSGDARPLVAVLEHNRLDLMTLAAITARLLRLVTVGPAAARDAREMFALGTTYARAGLDDRARNCFARAVAKSSAPPGAFDAVRLDSLRALALAWRRAREFERAAACWRQILETRGCPPALHREAAEALAIHHEHRVRDLDAAKAFALRSLVDAPRPAWTQAVQHRLARLDRKMSVGRLL
jgi:uncharacterized protein